MYVRLNVSDQFGPDGPQTGDHGEVMSIEKMDGDYWAFIDFFAHEPFAMYGWVKLEHILWNKATDTDQHVMSTICPLE